MTLPTPTIEYGLLSPMLIVFAAAVTGVLVEALLPPHRRYPTQLALSLAALTAAFAAVIQIARNTPPAGRTAVLGAVAVDAPALFLQAAILAISILAVLLIAQRRHPTPTHTPTHTPTDDTDTDTDTDTAGGLDWFTPQAATVPGSTAQKLAAQTAVMQTEVFPLTLFAVGGMLLFPAANDLLTMFIALEVLSLPLYLMCGLARRRRLLSQEAALKYFLLGAFSSAFFLYGAAMLYGYSGTLNLAGIADTIEAKTGAASLALIGAGLTLTGLLFKIGAVPFHSWIPDISQGAPTPITAFMAAATKIAAFGALLRICYIAIPEIRADWQPALWAVAIATMTIGTLTAITQTDIKRMLAYSAIAHTGFILTGVIALNQTGLSATLFYLFAYGYSTLGAFTIIGLVQDTTTGAEATTITQWAGLGRRHPTIAAAFTLYLLALAGIPLTSGFISKLAVFNAASQAGATTLVIIGVTTSAIAAYIYFRIIVLMFFTDPPHNAPTITPNTLTTTIITTTATLTLALGLLPQPLLNLANTATNYIR